MLGGLVMMSLLISQTPLVISGDGLILEVHGRKGIDIPEVESGNLSIEGSNEAGYKITGRSTVGLVYIPDSSDVLLVGHGAGVSLIGLKGRIKVSTDYSNIKVLDFNGTLEVGGKGNQLALIRCNGRIQGADRLGDIKISRSRGIVDITGDLSRLDMTAFEGLANLKVNGWINVKNYRGSLSLNSKFVQGMLENMEGLINGTALSGTLKMRNVRSTGVLRRYRAVIVPIDVEGVEVIDIPEEK